MTHRPLCYAFTVVTDAFLLQYVASFQRGLPQDLIELVQSPDIRGSTITFAQYAIRESNRPLLERLFRYYTEQTEYFHSQPTLSFFNVWLYAVKQNQLEIAQWIDTQSTLQCWAKPEQIMDAVSECGSVEILVYVLTHQPEVFKTLNDRHIANIAATGAVEMLTWLEENDPRPIPYHPYAAMKAAKNGHLSMIRHLHEKFSRPWSTLPMDAAAGNGHLEVVKFLHEHRTDGCTVNAMDAAAKGGFLDVVRFLHEKRTEGRAEVALSAAVAKGHLAVVQFLCESVTNAPDETVINENQSVFDSDSVIEAVVKAAKHGDLTVLQYLHEKSIPKQWTPEVMDTAASRGHLDIVRFLHEHRTEGCTTQALDAAAGARNLDLVQFLHEHRSEGCTTQAMDLAAGSGRLDIVRFLHEHRQEGCTKEAMNSAARGGHLEVVQFLLNRRTEGYPTKAMEAAAEGRHLSIVRFFLDHDLNACSTPTLEAALRNDWIDIAHTLIARDPMICSPEALRLVAEHGDFEFTKELFALVPRVLPWTATDAARNGHTQIMKFLIERVPNCCHEHVIVGAASGGNLEAVQYLHDHYHRYCTSSTLYEAAKSGHVHVLKYLLANCCLRANKLLVRAAYSGNVDAVRFVLENCPDRCLEEAREVAIRREFVDIIELLTQAMEHQNID